MTDMPQELRDVPPPNTDELTAMAEVHRQRLESLAATDLAIDQMMRQLESTGELGRTYVMFTSDNGYFLGEHGIRAGKVLPYDAALRVPLLIRGPGIPAGQVRHDPFLTTDLAPTVMQMAGLEIPDSVDGAGMLPVAEDGDLGWTRPVLVNTGPGSTVRNTDESGVPLDPEDPGSAGRAVPPRRPHRSVPLPRPCRRVRGALRPRSGPERLREPRREPRPGRDRRA